MIKKLINLLHMSIYDRMIVQPRNQEGNKLITITKT